jgi:hypothetical protein
MMRINRFLIAALSISALYGVARAGAQAEVPSALPQPKNWTTAEDHRNMMEQLCIKALRAGPQRQ